MEFVLISKILFVGDFIDFVMSELESVVGVVEASADGDGLDDVDEEEIEDLLSEYWVILVEVTWGFDEVNGGVEEVSSFETVPDPLDHVLEYIEGEIN